MNEASERAGTDHDSSVLGDGAKTPEQSGCGETLYDLVHGLDEQEVLSVCAEVDPDNAGSYPPVLRQLKQLSPVASDLTVVIRPWEGEDCYDVTGRKAGDDTNYAIEFTPWPEWLGAGFCVENCDLTPARILAECLNEMTWGGWTQEESEDKLAMIVGRAEEVMDMLEDEAAPQPKPVSRPTPPNTDESNT